MRNRQQHFWQFQPLLLLILSWPVMSSAQGPSSKSVENSVIVQKALDSRCQEILNLVDDAVNLSAIHQNYASYSFDLNGQTIQQVRCVTKKNFEVPLRPSSIQNFKLKEIPSLASLKLRGDLILEDQMMSLKLHNPMNALQKARQILFYSNCKGMKPVSKN